MGFLFGNDKGSEEGSGEESNSRNLEQLPDGYYIEDDTIYDSMGNKVSLGYHNIDFPTGKLGASTFRLIEINGFFIPDDKRIAWDMGLRRAVSVHNSIQKGYLEAVYDLHGSCPDKFRGRNTIEQKVRKHGGEEMYGGEKISWEDSKGYRERDKAEEIVDNTKHKAKNENLEMDVDADNLIILIKAYVSGVLVEESSDWIALSSSYENLFFIIEEYISKNEPVDSLRYAESMMDIWIPPEEYEAINECTKLNSGKNSNNETLTQVEKELERELMWN